MPLQFQPMPLLKRSFPFDDVNWLFELKYDGFKALAVIENGRSQLISRNGHPFASFADLAQDIRAAVPNTKLTVLDGEIVCLDKKGKPQFRNLLFRRSAPCFFAFDLLTCDGKDWRTEPLTDRKQELRRLLAKVSPPFPLRYVLVEKLKSGAYVADRERTTWVKILNREYSQMLARLKIGFISNSMRNCSVMRQRFQQGA